MSSDRGVALGVLALVLSIIALFVVMAVTAELIKPGASPPVTARLNSF
jgi:hypothetical protein